MVAEGMCFPKTVDELKPVLDIATEFKVHHLNLQGDVRPRRLEDGLTLIEGWHRLAEEVDFPVYVETHRDRLTTDLYYTLDLVDGFPGIKLLADLSHFLVGREFAYPVNDEDHALIHRILDQSWAFHGRVASREQVQVEIAFPHHKIWLDLFAGWWDYGFRSWRRRSGADDVLLLHLRARPETLCDHRAGRQRHDGPLGRSPDAQGPGAGPLDGLDPELLSAARRFRRRRSRVSATRSRCGGRSNLDQRGACSRISTIMSGAAS